MIGAAGITAEPGKITRLYSPEHRRAAALVGEWMRQAGLSVRMDAAGTHGSSRRASRARAPTASSSARISTRWSMPGADGNLGVVAGIVAVEELARRGELPFGLEIPPWRQEGALPEDARLVLDDRGMPRPDGARHVDAAGMPIRGALAEFAAIGLPRAEAYLRGDVIGYLEVHRAGPAQIAGEALGVVSAIASQGRYRLTARGEAGHAGTVPMALRHDALAALAGSSSASRRWRGRASATRSSRPSAISARPGAVNVIPGEAVMSLGVRAANDAARVAAEDPPPGPRHRPAARRRHRHGDDDREAGRGRGARLKRAIAGGIEAVTGRKPRSSCRGPAMTGGDDPPHRHRHDLRPLPGRDSHNPWNRSPSTTWASRRALVRTIPGSRRAGKD